MLRYVGITLLVGVAILAWGVLNNHYPGTSPLYMVLGKSMYPTLLEYDLVLTIPKPLLSPEDINVGDIIVFRLPYSPNTRVIHRVVAICDTGYVTKGDNNPAPDPIAIQFDSVLGKVLTVHGNPVRINSVVFVVILIATDLIRKGVGLRSG